MQSDPSVMDTVVTERQSIKEPQPEDTRKIDSLIGEDRRQLVLAAIATWHPGETVDLLVRLHFRQAQKLFV